MRTTSLLRRCAITVLSLACILQVSASAALMVDTAPSWRDASDASTTLSIWTFSNSAKSDIAPDSGSYNLYGTAGDDWYATVSPSTLEKKWISALNGADGVWALSGQVYAAIPNTGVTGEGTSKIVQVQLVWTPESGYTTSTSALTIEMEGSDGVVCETIEQAGATVVCQTYELANGWYQTIWTIEWPYNPLSENITIKGNVYIDSLIIDTICIPEPTTLAIMGLGIAAMWRTRKK